ncbi:MAG: MFS transporter [Bacteroidales bacterium]|nr:MFS transporter [Bacteroidales bacterium]
MSFTRQQISLISIASVAAFMGTFLISSVNIALPHIEQEFHLTAIELGWTITSFLLATAILLLPIGRWADINGVYKTYKAGIVIFTLASLACGIVQDGFWFIIFRFMQGIGAAFTNATGTAILVSAFPQQYRGRVLGISIAGVYLGLATGPFIGGLITQYVGWRVLFYLAAVIGIIIAILAFRILKDTLSKSTTIKETFSYTESLIYMAGLIMLVFGSSKLPHPIGWLMMAGGLITLFVFWQVENRSTYPLFDTRLFTHNRLFAYSNLAALINYSATYSIVFILSLYLQKIKGLSPRDAGAILITQPLIMAIFSPISGRFSDKIQPNIIASAGMLMCSSGLLVLSFLTPSFPIWAILLTLVWLGTGFALFSSPNMNTIMSSVEKNQYGIASATASTMRVVGQIASMTFITVFFALIIGNKPIDMASPSQFLSITKYCFILFATICLIGVYFSYYRGKLHIDDSSY